MLGSVIKLKKSICRTVIHMINVCNYVGPCLWASLIMSFVFDKGVQWSVWQWLLFGPLSAWTHVSL